MRFLFKLAFWLGIVVLLLPNGDFRAVMGAAVSDMRQFCSRQPDACAVGSQALVELGYKAQAGAKTLYELLNDKLGHEPREHTGTLAGSGPRKPSQNTLTPADLALPWHGPPPRKESEPRRPA